MKHEYEHTSQTPLISLCDERILDLIAEMRLLWRADMMLHSKRHYQERIYQVVLERIQVLSSFLHSPLMHAVSFSYFWAKLYSVPLFRFMNWTDIISNWAAHWSLDSPSVLMNLSVFKTVLLRWYCCTIVFPGWDPKHWPATFLIADLNYWIKLPLQANIRLCSLTVIWVD